MSNEWTKTLNEKQQRIEELRHDLQRRDNVISEMRVALREREKLYADLLHDLAAEKKLCKVWEKRARGTDLPFK